MTKQETLDLYNSIKEISIAKGIKISYDFNYLNKIIHANSQSLKDIQSELKSILKILNSDKNGNIIYL